MSASTSKKKEYLNYIRILHARETDKTFKTGSTNWAIIAGIIFVIWHLFKLLSTPDIPKISKPDLLIIFGQTYLLIAYSAIFINVLGESVSVRIFNNRVKTSEELNLKIKLFALLLGVLPFAAHTAIYFTPSKIPFENIINTTNFVLLTIMLLIYFYNMAKDFNKPQNYPRLEAEDKLVSDIEETLNVVLFFSLAIALAYIIGIKFISDNLSIFIIISFDITLILFGISVLLDRSLRNKRLLNLSLLERDTVLHDLKVDDIRDRIQKEFLGYYIGDWIEEKLKNITTQKNDFLNFISDIDSKVIELKKIDSSYKHEIDGRVSELTKKMTDLHNNYDKSVRELTQWIHENSENTNSTISKILMDTLQEIDSDLSKTTHDIQDTKDKLSALLRDTTAIN